jgi:hypothetical protein
MSDVLSRIRKVEQWQRGFTVRGAATFKNAPDGASLSIHEQQRVAPVAPHKDVLVRIAADLDGQGKYDGYIQMAGTNTASLGATNNVALSTLLTDGERVVFWNTEETAASASSPSGTNRTHTLDTGAYIPGHASRLSEASGTNTLRVFWNYLGEGGGGGIDSGLVIVTGNLSGGGKYTGNLLGPTGSHTPDNTSNLVNNDFGTAGESVHIYNILELGQGAVHYINPSSTNAADVRFFAWDSGILSGTSRVFFMRDFPAYNCS